MSNLLLADTVVLEKIVTPTDTNWDDAWAYMPPRVGYNWVLDRVAVVILFLEEAAPVAVYGSVANQFGINFDGFPLTTEGDVKIFQDPYTILTKTLSQTFTLPIGATMFPTNQLSGEIHTQTDITAGALLLRATIKTRVYGDRTPVSRRERIG